MAAQKLHDVQFPNESRDYREARNELLLAEQDLRRQIERVAGRRRALPLGGEVPHDYAFDEVGALSGSGPRTGHSTKLSGLFGDKQTLIAYSYMYGPAMEEPCPMCSSMLDALDGQVQHITQRASVAVIAKSPAERIGVFARERGWSRLRLLSSANNRYNADYRGEDSSGYQRPALNVFARRDGKVFHTYCTELMFLPGDSGQDPRHIDMIWPLWNALDLTPEGRSADWRPKLNYRG